MPADETRGGLRAALLSGFGIHRPPPLKCEIGTTIDDAIKVMALDSGKRRSKEDSTFPQ
jgi:hypothetical protein